MINLDKIEEWIREVEERSSSGPMIIRYIANRLSELSKRNEALLTENIELRTDKKVEEYESRIANLEYQVGLLKRQLGGMAPLDGGAISTITQDTVNLFFFHPAGQIVRAKLPLLELTSGQEIAQFNQMSIEGTPAPGFFATNSQEELLLIYDSGRTMTLRVEDIPASEQKSMSWSQAFIREPRSNETLSAIAPVGRMSLYEYAIQVSRRGFAKKIMEGSFESFIAKDFIGSGVKAPPDKPFGLVFGRKEDWLVLVSREGYLLCIEIGRLPFAVEELIHLNSSDHIESAMVIPRASGSSISSSIVVVTDNGKIINRDESWLEPATSFHSRGQSLISKEKRSSGIQVVGARLFSPADWGFAYHSGGQISAHGVGELIDTGVISISNVDKGKTPIHLSGFYSYPGSAGR